MNKYDQVLQSDNIVIHHFKYEVGARYFIYIYLLIKTAFYYTRITSLTSIRCKEVLLTCFAITHCMTWLWSWFTVSCYLNVKPRSHRTNFAGTFLEQLFYHWCWGNAVYALSPLMVSPTASKVLSCTKYCTAKATPVFSIFLIVCAVTVVPSPCRSGNAPTKIVRWDRGLILGVSVSRRHKTR